MKQMVWSKEKSFEGFTCTDCGWLFPNPRLDFDPVQNEQELRNRAQKEFDSHECAKYPKTPRVRHA